MAKTEAELLKNAGLPEQRENAIGKRFMFDCRDEHQNGVVIFGFIDVIRYVSIEFDIIIVMVRKPRKLDGIKTGDLLYANNRWVLLRSSEDPLYGKLSLTF